MKKILTAIGVLLAALVIMLAVSVIIVGPMIKSAVNILGPEIARTEVKLGGVRVSLFSASAALTDFLLGNPPGFNTPQAVTVEKIYIEMDKTALLRDPIVIDRVEVVAPHINYEISGRTDNIRALLTMMKKPDRRGQLPDDDKSATPARGKKSGKNILIRELVVRDGLVDLAASMIKGQAITVALPDLHLTNIGHKDDGVSPEEMSKLILYAVYTAIQSTPVTEALNEQLRVVGATLDQLKGEVEKAIDKRMKELNPVTGAFTDSIKGQINKFVGK